MTNQEKLKIDDKIMKLLEASTIRRSICKTNKGALELCIVKGGTEYYLTLDSVPVEKELNRELMGILFKSEIPQITDTTLPTTLLEPKSLKKKSYYKSKKTLGKTN